MKLCRTNLDKAKELGVAYATHMYDDFINHSEYLGSKWEWKNFPALVFRFSKVEAFLYFNRNSKNFLMFKKVFVNTAKQEAKKLMKDGKWKKVIIKT